MATKNQKTAYGKWYSEHKKTYNEKRRERYKNDPEYRKRTQSNSKSYRKSKQVERDKGTRTVGKITVTVHSLKEVADLLSRGIQSISNWEKKEWIPKCVFDEHKKLYTTHQVELMKPLAKITTKYRAGGFKGKRQEYLNKLSKPHQ